MQVENISTPEPNGFRSMMMITTITKPDPENFTPEHQWRGEYAIALIKSGATLKEIYLQALLAASLALDVLGRE
jgi:hypothetical protein